MNGLVAFVVWRSDVRHFVVLINVLAILALAGYLAWSVFSRRGPEKTPANQTRFLSDDDLEGRRLERVLGWSLMFVTLFAVVMLVYMVREPVRQEHSDRPTSRTARSSAAARCSRTRRVPAYNSVLSLQCANCHGS